MVLNCVFCGLGCVEGVSVVAYCNGEESPNTAGGRCLSVKSYEIYSADLAVKLVEPAEVATVTLGVNVRACHTVNIIDIVVGKAVAGSLFNKGRNLEDLSGDILGYGSVHNFFNSAFGNPALVKVGATLIV